MKKMIAALLVLLPATAGLSFGQNRGRTPTRLPTSSNETPSTQTPRASQMADPYRDLFNNISIFARDHRGVGDRTAPVITPPPAVNPETYLVFRGVVKEGAKFIGFIEDTRDSSTFKVNVGDPLGAQGTQVARLDVDELVIRRASGGQSPPIELGCNLLGREVAPPEPAIQPATFSRQGNTFARQGTLNDLIQIGRQGNNPRRGTNTRGNQDPTQTQNRNPNGRGTGRRRGGGGGGNIGG